MTSATTKSRQHVPVTRLHPRYIVEQQSIKIRSFVPSRDQSRWKHSYSGASEIAIIVMPFQFCFVPKADMGTDELTLSGN
jgi:hypothetical protein